MATPEQEAPQDRKKKTLWLMAGGAVSLLIPLAGAFYMHWSQNAGAPGPSGRSDVFERREGDDRKILPTQTVVMTSPSGLPSRVAERPAGSSLDFIKSNAEMQARVNDPKAAVAAPPAPALAAPAAPAVPEAPAKAGKPGKKAFVMPKLQPSRGFTSFGSGKAKGGAKKGAQPTNDDGQSAQDILKSLPPGSENDPRVQQYLKSHQGQ